MTDEITPTPLEGDQVPDTSESMPADRSPSLEPTVLGSVYVANDSAPHGSAPGASEMSAAAPMGGERVAPYTRTITVRRWHTWFAAGVAAVLIFLAGTWFGSALARHAAFARMGGAYAMQGRPFAAAPNWDNAGPGGCGNPSYGYRNGSDGQRDGFGRGGRHRGWGSQDSTVTTPSVPGTN